MVYPAIRNPVYCGKVFIGKYKDENAYFVNGQHEPLISEDLFYKIQDILDGNKRVERPNSKILSPDNLPLRNFLVCPVCGKNLTGSASKGSKGVHYYYYHCIPSCGFRKNADHANKLFEKELQKFEFPIVIKDVLQELLEKNYKNFLGVSVDRRKSIVNEIEKLNLKVSKAREFLFADKIDAEDYKIMKEECKVRIEKLEEELTKQMADRKNTSIKARLGDALTALTSLSILYRTGDIETKRSVISSIYPEKLEFDGSAYRTPRLNTIANLILLINTDLNNKKNRTNEVFFHLSGLVAKTGVEPVTSGL